MAVVHGGDLFGAAAMLGLDWRDLLDFSASINPLGPAPGVRAAIVNALDTVVHYPDPQAAALVAALAEEWHVPAGCILAGNGATELLHFLARVTAPAEVTLAVPVFSEFNRAYRRARTVPADDPKTWPGEGWLIATNPLNPSGALLDRTALVEHIMSSTQPVLIDESFLDFTDEPSVLALAARRADLFVLKSLTKFYALPGLRVGALIASEATIAKLKPYREPWQVNVLAEAAAIASIRDTDYRERTRQYVAVEREWLASELAAIEGATVLPSCANYLAVQVTCSAAELATRLRRRGILIRDCGGWLGVGADVVRVAVRSRAENQRLLENWRTAVCEL